MAEEYDLAKELKELGLPDDLEEVALKEEPAPSAEAVARIQQMALTRVEADAVRPAPVVAVQPRQRRRPWLGLVAAAVAGLVVVTGIIGPGNVLAQVQRLLSYVPGFGTREAGEVYLAAAGPMRLERDDRWVEVAGVLVDQSRVMVHLTSRNVRLNAEQVMVEGQPLARGGSSVMGTGGAGSKYDGWYTFTGNLASGLRSIVIVVADSEPWRFTVPLVPADRLVPVAEFGPAAVANGYTVQAQVRSYADRSDLTLLVRGGVTGSRVTGPYYSQPITLSAGQWQSSRMEQILSGGGELFRREADPVPPGVASVRVMVPRLAVDEPGEAGLRLDVADRTVNQTLTLGRWTLKVLRTEFSEKGLRVYVEPENKGTAKLERYGQLTVNGESVSHTSRRNAQTEQLEWLEFPVPFGAKSVQLSFKGASVIVSGPWAIDLPVQRTDLPVEQ